MEVTFEQNDQTIEIPSPQATVGKTGLTFAILFILLVFTGISFVSGYVFGRAQINSEKSTTGGKSTSKTADGKTTFESPSEKYSIVFPESWKLTERESGTPGVLIQNESNSVELWLRVEQPYSLSPEQKDAISTTNKVKIKVNNKEIEMTEHAYKTGGFFSVVVVPATTKTTLATFWIKTIDKESYTTALEIVKSFKFN